MVTPDAETFRNVLAHQVYSGSFRMVVSIDSKSSLHILVYAKFGAKIEKNRCFLKERHARIWDMAQMRASEMVFLPKTYMF